MGASERENTTASDIEARYHRAVEKIVERAKADQHILAVILFGSLSYDVVWEKSDIDLFLVCQEKSKAEKKVDHNHIALNEEDINIHAQIVSRSELRKLVEGGLQSSFMHSTFARSQLLWSRDPGLASLYEDIERMGERDRQLQLFQAATWILPGLAKAEKFCYVKRDPHYSSIWITYLYAGLARIESHLHGKIADREVIQQALALNPDFFGAIYTDFLDAPKTLETVSAVLEQIEAYLMAHIREMFQPLLAYLAAEGEPRSVTQIDAWCQRHLGVGGASLACEWLADQGVLTKAAVPVRITKRSQTTFDELAFLYVPDESNDEDGCFDLDDPGGMFAW